MINSNNWTNTKAGIGKYRLLKEAYRHDKHSEEKVKNDFKTETVENQDGSQTSSQLQR